MGWGHSELWFNPLCPSGCWSMNRTMFLNLRRVRATAHIGAIGLGSPTDVRSSLFPWAKLGGTDDGEAPGLGMTHPGPQGTGMMLGLSVPQHHLPHGLGSFCFLGLSL